MMPLVLFVLVAWLALSGLARIVAPSWQLSADKKKATTENLAAPPSEADRKRLNGIRLGGAIRLAVVAAIIWLGGVTVGRTPSPRLPTGANDLQRVVFEKGAEFIRRGKAAGLTIAAVSGDREVVMEIGVSRLFSGEPVSNDTLFEIGSITKAFTGIALAHDVETGELKLEDKAAALLPNGFEIAAEAREVTLRHLTTHTSGFPRLPGQPRIRDIVNFILLGGDPYLGITLERFGEALRKVKLESKPGEKMAYSNFGVSLLGWLLAQRKGMDYEEYIRARVLQPLGMNDSGIDLDASQQKRFAQGYRSVKRLGPITVALRSAPWNLPSHLAGAGGIRATGGDLLKFLRANMRPHRVGISQAIQKSQEELFQENNQRSVGMNWIRSRKEKGETPIIWHNGGTGGFMSYLGFKADGSVGVLVLSNTSESVDRLGTELLRALAEQPKP